MESSPCTSRNASQRVVCCFRSLQRRGAERESSIHLFIRSKSPHFPKSEPWTLCNLKTSFAMNGTPVGAPWPITRNLFHATELKLPVFHKSKGILKVGVSKPKTYNLRPKTPSKSPKLRPKTHEEFQIRRNFKSVWNKTGHDTGISLKMPPSSWSSELSVWIETGNNVTVGFGFPTLNCKLTLCLYPGAPSIRPKIPEIPGWEANGTDIFRNFFPKFWVYLARLA